METETNPPLPDPMTKEEILADFDELITGFIEDSGAEALFDHLWQHISQKALGERDWQLCTTYWSIHHDFAGDWEAACLAYNHELRTHEVLFDDFMLPVFTQGAVVAWFGWKGFEPEMSKEEVWARQQEIFQEIQNKDAVFEQIQDLVTESFEVPTDDGRSMRFHVVDLSDVIGRIASGQFGEEMDRMGFEAFGGEDDDAQGPRPE